jgi:hypothetical protein
MHNFTTGPPSGQGAYPLRLGLVGDVGLTFNSTDTIAHLVASQPEMVIFTGGEGPSAARWRTCTLPQHAHYAERADALSMC